MDYWLLARAIGVGVTFGAIVSLAYRWFRRDRREAAAHAWTVFVVLAVIVAIRFYFLNAP